MNQDKVDSKIWLRESDTILALDYDRSSDIESENCIGPISNFQFQEGLPIKKYGMKNNSRKTGNNKFYLQNSNENQKKYQQSEEKFSLGMVNQRNSSNHKKLKKYALNLKNEKKSISNISDANSISQKKLERFDLFSKRVSNSILKNETKRKLMAKKLEEEELRECTFLPQILRASSQGNLNKSNDYSEQVSKKEKFRFTERLKNDLKSLNSMKPKPTIQRNHICSTNSSCSFNVFEKLSSIKKVIKEDPEKFPFKPTIHPYVKKVTNQNVEGKSQSKIENIKHKIPKAKKKLEQLLQKSNEKIDFQNDKHAKRKFDREICEILNELNFFGEDISKDEMIYLLSKLSFISNSMNANDQNLLNSFWEISRGTQKEKAKLSNIKLILFAITGIIKSFLFEEKSKENNNDIYLIIQEENFTFIKQSDVANKESVELTFLEGKEMVERKRIFLYDGKGRLILIQNDILFLRKLFIPFYCKRFCLKGKKEATENVNNDLTQLNKSNLSINSKINISKQIIPNIIERLYKPSKKSISKIPVSSDIKRNEIIQQISTFTPLRGIKESKKILNITSSSKKITDRLNYCKKRTNNKVIDNMEFEKSIPEYTFSPVISNYERNNSSFSISKLEEKSIQRMKDAVFHRSMSEQIPFYECKRGQTTIKNSIEYKKFTDEFKGLRDTDNALKNLVKKYSIKLNCTTNNINPNRSMNLITKIEESYQVKNLNIQPLSQNNVSKKSLYATTKNIYKEDNSLNNKKKSNDKIARIEINTPSGLKTINVRPGENLYKISQSIAQENKLDYEAERKIYNFLKEQVDSKFK